MVTEITMKEKDRGGLNMKKRFTILLVMIGLLFCAISAQAEEEVVFDFEDGIQGWEIPDWAYEKPDHVQNSIEESDRAASNGNMSLMIDTDFPGGSWSGAIVEVMEYFDWSDFSTLACDIFIPEGAPEGLKAKIILTVGDTWKWVEMSRDYSVKPGEWVTMKADLMPGSIDWRRVQVDDSFRRDIRKIDVRIVSNNKPAYTGPIYLDNIRVIK